MKVDGYTLRECPFCGKDVADFATAKELEDCQNSEDEDVCPAYQFDCHCNRFTICCNVHKGGCGATTGYAWGREMAAEKWNRRAYEDTDKK